MSTANKASIIVHCDTARHSLSLYRKLDKRRLRPVRYGIGVAFRVPQDQTVQEMLLLLSSLSEVTEERIFVQ